MIVSLHGIANCISYSILCTLKKKSSFFFSLPYAYTQHQKNKEPPLLDFLWGGASLLNLSWMSDWILCLHIIQLFSPLKSDVPTFPWNCILTDDNLFVKLVPFIASNSLASLELFIMMGTLHFWYSPCCWFSKMAYILAFGFFLLFSFFFLINCLLCWFLNAKC